MKRSIKWKLTSIIVKITMIILAFSYVIMAYYSYTQMSEQLIKNAQASVSELSWQFKSIEDSCNQTKDYIITNSRFLKLFSKKATSGVEKYYIRSSISESLQEYVILNKYIKNVITVNSMGEIYSQKFINSTDYYQKLIDENEFSSFIHSKQRTMITYKESFFIEGSEEPAIILTYKFKQPDDHYSNDNIIIFVLQAKDIISVLDIYNFNNVSLYNGTDPLISKNGDLSTLTPEDFQNGQKLIDSKGYLSLISPLSFGLTAICEISKQDIFSVLQNLVLFFILIACVTLVIMITALSKTILHFIAPIFSIIKAMRLARTGNLQVRTHIVSGDEFEVLSNDFNGLVCDLSDYIDKLIEKEKVQKELEMELLVSQINPHFMYNTLTSIKYLTIFGRNEEAVESMDCFITLLQSSIVIDNNSIFIPIENEIDKIKKYIFLQKIRYPDKFEVVYDIKKEMLNKKIPQNIIQPLVENAIFHGIVPSSEQGIINLSIFCKNNYIHLVVSDNGIGISKERIPFILSETSQPIYARGIHKISIPNIQKRLKYLYPHQYTMTMDSTNGTTVHISFPEDPNTSNTN